ncbi:MAG: inositol 2-dehydrogenase [Bacteroidota bacterium]
MKMGLAGLGRIGKIHLQNLQNNSAVTEISVCVPSENSREYARKRGIKRLYANFDQMLEQEELDAVCISSPSDTHLEFAHKAVDKGLQVFCEKPLDFSVKAMEDLQQKVKEKGIRFMVGFNKRFDPEFMKAKNLLKEGKIGSLQLVSIKSVDPAPPPVSYITTSGGLYMDMVIHDFDMARFMVEAEVESVYASGNALADPAIASAGDISVSQCILNFQNGVVVSILNSRKSGYGYDQRLEMWGSKGLLGVQNPPRNHIELWLGEEKTIAGSMDFFLERFRKAYEIELNAFILSLVEESSIPVSIHDAIQATAIALAAQKSMEEDRKVTLEEIYSSF